MERKIKTVADLRKGDEAYYVYSIKHNGQPVKMMRKVVVRSKMGQWITCGSNTFGSDGTPCAGRSGRLVVINASTTHEFQRCQSAAAIREAGHTRDRAERQTEQHQRALTAAGYLARKSMPEIMQAVSESLLLEIFDGLKRDRLI